MTPRAYSNIAVATTLAAGITALSSSLTVADATGYPAAPFAIVVDAGASTSEEVMLVTAKAGAVFTVTRGYDGTTANAHSAGASVIHAAIADDLRGMQLGGRDVSSAAPSDLDAMLWDNGAQTWAPGPVSGGGSGVIPYTYATGTLTLATQPTAGDTITLGGLTFTYTNNFGVPGEIMIGADLAETQANTVSTVNAGIAATFPDAGALSFSANVSTIVAAVAGTAGNGIVTTSVFTDAANHFNQAALAGGTDGTDSGHIQAQTAVLSGASPGTPLLRLQTAPGQDALAANNVLELVDADGNELIKIDSGGNLYTLRDLRMVDPSNNAIFTIQSSGKIFFRFPDVDDTARWFLRGVSSDTLVFALRPNANKTALINAHGAGAVALEIDTAGVDDTDLIQAYGNANFDLVFRLMQSGAVVIAQHSAPDDGDLNTGDMALWFDQTTGAAKLMIKAKDEIGTVVTGEVALT